jgi:hypothetical protein
MGGITKRAEYFNELNEMGFQIFEALLMFGLIFYRAQGGDPFAHFL